MIIENEEGFKEIFIENINTIIIDSMEISLSIYLLNELRKNKINVLFCDEKHIPAIQFQSIYGCFDCANKINKQVSWKDSNKAKVWIKLLKNKIKNQYKLLKQCNIKTFDLEKYSNIKIGDPDNIEGTIAKMYFSRLFGKSFNRRNDSNTNALLNYGYSIIASCISRDIISLGYLTTIGINHKNGTNNYNFTYDIIEPFRPFVDKIVYGKSDCELSNETKQELVNVLYTDCIYKKRRSNNISILPVYISDIVESIETGRIVFGDIELV